MHISRCEIAAVELVLCDICSNGTVVRTITYTFLRKNIVILVLLHMS